jgi:outer membrane protein OmpA-like peptidoglycan-associated protein
MDEIIIEKPIVLENIYYDLDKWFIRPDAAKELDKLVTVMNENSTLKIELSSHTDSRAGDQYNLVLSDKRAKAAVAYLVSKGVDAKRMTWKGYGESKLVNHCKNNVPCSEEEHQKNRRTEFKAVKEIKSVVKRK